ncbi:homocitrate synthase [candidate division WOR-1 bacterium RIFOXYB2_FULL_42_35]|uniref:Homocitrate synthase n=1 Tax=candidate division WOR-1 bacterium RIFOXYC2_FULL_41_25 TaxID=1802586 RepID=A0A1F4TK56_UNCSA|nr:MAG: homocitrate synthase [candidate division WOR-1 bacterium RIFOXYA2_FULL_41_14]OGC22433.1 MAG: homocitrate synthase [candidate division WOR-1 bacterium RIFOXYB2_FULL_42_35]OGC33111.1 MAG: homocitrate synthase [candidate division WOR-1 bacterium RIFOXYC2_FULL_41_25]OGC43425.1 MAG: homocitrate synthase [candidate division WOR-1 bacterium RIFOXYD2_FULL_41_8]
MVKKKKPQIYIIDVTNRDGVQTSRIGLAKLEKTIINLYLNDMGIFQSEFGFPFTKHETNYLNANLKLQATGKELGSIRLEGWCRAMTKDIDLAFKMVPKIKHLNLSVSTSDIMLKGKFGDKKSKDDIINMMTEAVDAAYKKGAKSIGVNAEDASRSDMDYLIKFAKAAKEHGATRIRYCDTLGAEDPMNIYKRLNQLAQETEIAWELHCHNDLGMGVACSVAGAKGVIDAGQDAYINTTINGVGERAGNADLLSVLLALKYSSGFKNENLFPKGINLKKAWTFAQYASYAFDIPIPLNQVGIGSNAFAHESGIHADGALKNRRNYELYDYEELGLGETKVVETGRMITVGEYSGIKGFRNVYGKLAIEFKDDNEAAKILELARYANVHTQKSLTENELYFVARYPEIARLIMTVTP